MINDHPNFYGHNIFYSLDRLVYLYIYIYLDLVAAAQQMVIYLVIHTYFYYIIY